MNFSKGQLNYLMSQHLGRLATIRPDGTLQNSPVRFKVDEMTGTIDIGGRTMGDTRKFSNVQANGQVAFVVDDLASVDPWTTRMIEIRGTAEALTGQTPVHPGQRQEVIRIHPTRIIVHGIED